MMKIAVASGKGGTGKTMVATSMAAALAPQVDVQFLDCDVEAPNAHLFLNPVIYKTKPATIKIPSVDEDICTLCSHCVDICEFNALAMLGEKILVFEQLCHGCGSCTIHCPVNAISEVPRRIGDLNSGIYENNQSYLFGELTISEPMPTPIIRQLKAMMRDDEELSILDSPPGASCSVVATLHDADYVILVTEPTPFGLHDLKQMLGVIQQTGAPAGVIINRDGIGDSCVEDYLSDKPYPILMKIPYQEDIAEGLAAGELLINILPEISENFLDLFRRIQSSVARKVGN
jgi:MinD superfamily P-loop ATPase